MLACPELAQENPLRLYERIISHIACLIDQPLKAESERLTAALPMFADPANL
jgi:hypothetical protein